jgi:hypothetical protein
MGVKGVLKEREEKVDEYEGRLRRRECQNCKRKRRSRRRGIGGRFYSLSNRLLFAFKRER